MTERKTSQRPAAAAAVKPDRKGSSSSAKAQRPTPQAYARFLLDRHRHAD